MKKFKVIHMAPSSPSYFLSSGKGGIIDTLKDNWFSQVARELKKSDRYLDIECWGIEKNLKKEKSFVSNGIKFRVFPTNVSVRQGMEFSTSMLTALKKEEKEVKLKGKELIFEAHEQHTWQSYLILLGKNRKTRFIAQHHGGRAPFEILRRYKRLLVVLPAILVMQLIENLFFRRIELFYSLGQEEDKYLKKVAPKSKVKFQTMGITDDYFKVENKNKLRARLKLDKNKKYVLFLGRIKTTKGIKELIDSAKGLDAEVLIIGKGQDSEKYMKYAAENKAFNVKFLGPIFGKKKMDYLAACDCLALPSYTEGAPVVIMEALARNLPVVATRVGAIPKMIKEGQSGILINMKSSEELRNAIRKILTWKKNVRKHAEKYKWKNIVKQTMGDYKK